MQLSDSLKTILAVLIIAWVLLGVVLVAGFSGWSFGRPSAVTQDPEACTMEAKLCPDGSYVSRTGPNCEFAECPAQPQVKAFGAEVLFTMGQSAQFTDGLTMKLEKINDSRCKEGVVCVWAGELSPVFSIADAAKNGELTLGTTNNKEVSRDGYTFSLKSATETTATVVVTKPVSATAPGTATAGAGCFIGGCSSQLCTDYPGAISDCMYRPEYSCYQKTNARCEKQANGQCGWTPTAALAECLK